MKNPPGKVPALEVDGKVLTKPLIISDYLEEVYPEPALYPENAWSKAKDKELIELWNKVGLIL